MPQRGRGLQVALVWLVAGTGAFAQDLPRGTIVDTVACADDPAETYALYLPSGYTPDRPWSLLLGFHPGARGRAIVETYRAAAERYGYIVAGSNTSRNGPWDTSIRAVRAVSKDLGRRFAIDARRLYLTGQSGGARVAMEVALGPNDVAGVIASSAGFADARPRTTVRFAVFATAGVDDFNLGEMQELDEALRSPHHLAVFDGGHALPPPGVAMEAVEWLELQAMRDRRRDVDADLVAAWVAARRTRVAAAGDDLARLRGLRALVADFDRLADVTAERARAEALERDPAVKAARARERDARRAEARLLSEALDVEARLRDADTRAAGLVRLNALLAGWSRAANADAPSPERSRARRLLGQLAGGAGLRIRDDEYRALLRQYRWRG
ncbi:MAG: hypothetical protein AB7O28_01625 [Vicinamibacterales bacterium]